MFNYANYNAVNAIFILMIALNTIIMSLTSACAEVIEQGKDAIPTFKFTYNQQVQRYVSTVDECVYAGGKLRIVYENARKDVLFKNSPRVYARYSFDGWQTCQDSQMSMNENGELSTIIDVNKNAANIQVAFFATYPYDNYRSWGFIWDSDYGKNFRIEVITKKEIEQKNKFDELMQMANK